MREILSGLPTNNFYSFCTCGSIVLAVVFAKFLLAHGAVDTHAQIVLAWLGLCLFCVVGLASAYAWLTRTQRYQDRRESGQSRTDSDHEKR
jgi:protein-S-isoprenylcysteine O-methyltransferase Ste14